MNELGVAAILDQRVVQAHDMVCQPAYQIVEVLQLVEGRIEHESERDGGEGDEHCDDREQHLGHLARAMLYRQPRSDHTPHPVETHQQNAEAHADKKTDNVVVIDDRHLLPSCAAGGAGSVVSFCRAAASGPRIWPEIHEWVGLLTARTPEGSLR